jgi:hypothetical protein
MTAPSSDATVEKFRTSPYIHTKLIRASEGARRQKKTNILLLSTKVFPALQSTTAEDILYRRMHVSACRKQGAHILRGVGEAHVL